MQHLSPTIEPADGVTSEFLSSFAQQMAAFMAAEMERRDEVRRRDEGANGWVSAKSAAQYLEVTERWIKDHWELLHARKLPGADDKPRWRDKPSYLDQVMEAGAVVELQTPKPAKTPKPKGVKRPRSVELLDIPELALP